MTQLEYSTSPTRFSPAWRRRVAAIIALTVVVSLALFVWPTLYRYDYSTRGTLVRTNRLTDQSDVLMNRGWVRLRVIGPSRATRPANGK